MPEFDSGIVDGTGRTIVTLAEGEETNQWIVNGLTEYMPPAKEGPHVTNPDKPTKR